MKVHYVYQLKNLEDKVEWVGETHRPSYRFQQHTKWKSCNGKFLGREDIRMEIIAQFPTRKQARELERELKIQNGLELTESTARRASILASAKVNRKLTIEQANEIRLKYSTGKYYQSDLAKEYGVYQTAISAIITNKTYCQ